MRVYIPATFSMLKSLDENGVIHARNGWGFAATPELTEFFTSGDQEEIEAIAFDDAALARHLETGTTFEDFFAEADMTADADLITGSVCGVKVQEVEDPLMKRIRQLDKVVDELAKGKSVEKVIRTPAA